MDNLLTDKDLDTIARAHHRCGEMEIERTLGGAAGAGEHLPRLPGLVRALPDPAGAVAAWDVQYTIF